MSDSNTTRVHIPDHIIAAQHYSEGIATALERFVYEYEPQDDKWWRPMLTDLIREAINDAQ